MPKIRSYARPLSARFVQTVTAPGKYHDGPGNGLCLHVTARGYKYWETRRMVNGRRRTYGIGPYPSVSRRDAREKAREVRDQAGAGHDPFVRRCRVRVLTVHEAAEATIELRRLQ